MENGGRHLPVTRFLIVSTQASVPPASSQCCTDYWLAGVFLSGLFSSFHQMRHCPQDGIKDVVELFADILGQKPQHQVSVLLQQRVLSAVAPIGGRDGSPNRPRTPRETAIKHN